MKRFFDSKPGSICCASRMLRKNSPAPTRATRESAISEITSRSEEHTSELQSPCNLVCRLLLEKKKKRSLVLQELIASTSAERAQYSLSSLLRPTVSTTARRCICSAPYVAVLSRRRARRLSCAD